MEQLKAFCSFLEEELDPENTFHYQNHHLCRLPLSSIYSLMIRTRDGDGPGRQRSMNLCIS